LTEVAPVPTGDPARLGPRATGATGRIARGIAANVGGIGLTLVIQLVSVPVFLAAWGIRTYGEWLVLSAVPTYVALSDLSFSSVAGNLMVMHEAVGNRLETVALGRRLWSVVTVMTGMAVFLAVGIALTFAGAFGGTAAIPVSEAQVILVALFLQVAVGNQYGVLDAWYRAAGRYPLSTVLRQVGRFLEFAALMGAVLLGARPGLAAVAFLAASTIGFGVSWVVLRRSVPWSTFRPERPRLSTFRELLGPGLAYMALPVGNAMSVQGLTIVVGSTLGAAGLVVFSTTRTVTRVALQLIGAINNSIWSELSRSIGGGNLGEARIIVLRSVQLALAGSLSLVLVLAILGGAIIRTWTHGLVDPPEHLLVLLLLVTVANSLWSTLSAVLGATNRLQRLAILYLATTTLAVAGAASLGSVFGLAGPAMALLAADLGMIGYVLPASLRVVGDAPFPFFRAVLDVRSAVRSATSSVRSST
jgi:O-antigen/teichoic acid export membrane protein